MGERDAFGREIGEDTLAGIRGEEVVPPGSVSPVPPAPASASPTAPRPQAASTPPAPPTPVHAQSASAPPGGGPRRTDGGAFGVYRGVAMLVVVIVIAAGAGSIAHTVKSVSSGISKIHIPKIHVANHALDVTKPAPTPTGLGAGSLLRPVALRHALRLIADTHDGRVKVLRIAPDRVDATLIDGRGRLHQIQIPAGGHGVRTLSVTGSGFPRTGTVPVGAFDAAAPARLVAGAARRAHVSPAHIDYVVAIASGGPPTWSAFFESGAQWLGDRHGHVQRRL